MRKDEFGEDIHKCDSCQSWASYFGRKGQPEDYSGWDGGHHPDCAWGPGGVRWGENPPVNTNWSDDCLPPAWEKRQQT